MDVRTQSSIDAIIKILKRQVSINYSFYLYTYIYMDILFTFLNRFNFMFFHFSMIIHILFNMTVSAVKSVEKKLFHILNEWSLIDCLQGINEVLESR